MVRRSALGTTLSELPERARRALPGFLKDQIRRRFGPFAPWEAGFAATAPEPMTGERTGPPDFVGIGVQKAGTTWWFELLLGHPRVYHRPSVHKELHFFARYAREEFGPKAVEDYRSWFPRPAGTITGEWTPDYIFQPWVAPLLAVAAPQVRLLVILRDPVERFLSGLAHREVYRVWSDVGTTTAEAVIRGFYAPALLRWREHFPAERILVLQYERCVLDLSGELARTCRFLGLDDAPLADPRRTDRPARGSKISLEPEARNRLVEIFAEDVAQLDKMVPDLDLALWPNFRAE